MSTLSNKILNILAVHKQGWATERQTLEKYTDAWSAKMWKSSDANIIVTDPGVDGIRIEPGTFHTYIESYKSALFAQTPSVTITENLKRTGDRQLVEKLCNYWLSQQSEALTTATTKATLYPFSAIKLTYSPNPDSGLVSDEVRLSVIDPWDVIVDLGADSVETMRYIGHRYFISAYEARKRWPRKKFAGQAKKDYLRDQIIRTGDDDFVEIVEFYDLESGKMVFWSDSVVGTSKTLSEESIPLTFQNGKPIPPIIPMYFLLAQDQPLKGMATSSLIYDSCFEQAIVRSSMANGVRRNSRQFFMDAAFANESALEQLRMGHDMAFVRVTVPEGRSLGEVVMPVPAPSMGADILNYASMTQEALESSMAMPSFTRGQATNVTATEIATLQLYASSEIGQRAKVRDRVVERVARCYIRFLYALMGAEDYDPQIVELDGQSYTLTQDQLEGDFLYRASNEGSTPASAALKRAKLIEAIPLLIQLGADQRALLEEIIAVSELSVKLLPPEQKDAIVVDESLPPTTDQIPVGGGAIAADLREEGEV